jgi:hypothetical protein
MSKATGKATVVRASKVAPAPVKPTPESVAAVAAKVLASFGGVDAAIAARKGAAETLARSEATILAWLPVATDATIAGVTAKEFAAMSGGNVNTLLRLTQVDRIIRARAAKKMPPNFERSYTEGQKPKAAVAATLAGIAKGVDPFAAPKPTRGGTSAQRKAKAAATTPDGTVKVTPEQYPAVMRLILANVKNITRPSNRADVRGLALDIAAALDPASLKKAAPARAARKAS